MSEDFKTRQRSIRPVRVLVRSAGQEIHSWPSIDEGSKRIAKQLCPGREETVIVGEGAVKNPEKSEMYRKAMRQYKENGWSERVNDVDRETVYYLLHHGVVRLDKVSNPLRVVFIPELIPPQDTIYIGGPFWNPNQIQRGTCSLCRRYQRDVSANLSSNERYSSSQVPVARYGLNATAEDIQTPGCDIWR